MPKNDKKGHYNLKNAKNIFILITKNNELLLYNAFLKAFDKKIYINFLFYN